MDGRGGGLITVATSTARAQPPRDGARGGAAAGGAPRPGTALAGSARAVAGTVEEEAGFLARPDGALFVVAHRPAAGPAAGWLTVCSSLYAEQHTDYRREVRLARLLASAGIGVARFHYRGVGNSAAGTATLDAFARDALDVTAATAGPADGQVAFLGVGAGSLVASLAIAAHPDAPLLLWKPVADGAQFFRDFFRARLIAATRAAGPRPDSTERLLARMAAEGHADVMGFAVAASLHASVTSARLAETVPRQPRRILLRPFRGARAAAAERLAADWTAAGCLVDVRPARLPEDPWFIPDGAAAAASVRAAEDELMAGARDWLLGAWRDGSPPAGA